MRSLIGQRTGEGTPRSIRPQNVATPLRPHSSMDSPGLFSASSQPGSGLDRLVAEADSSLGIAVNNHDAMQAALSKLSSAFKEVCTALVSLLFIFG